MYFAGKMFQSSGVKSNNFSVQTESEEGHVNGDGAGSGSLPPQTGMKNTLFVIRHGVFEQITIFVQRKVIFA